MIRIAYVSHQLDRGKNFGGGLVTSTNLALLKKVANTEIVVYSIGAKAVPGACHIKNTGSRYKTAIANLFGYSATLDSKANTKLVRLIENNKPDIVWLDSSLFGRTIQSLLKLDQNIKCVTFFHNIECDIQLNRVKKGNILYFASAISDWWNERIATKKSNKLIALHFHDSGRMKQVYSRCADYLLPVIVPDRFRDLYCFGNEFVFSKNILFVGSLYGPNIEGLKFLIKKVMPHVPFNLVVIGKGLEVLRSELTGRNVEVIGTVEDLEPYYYASRCVVSPIFSGGGMKVKVAEALMYGRPVIATPHALVGYEEVCRMECIRIASSPSEFISSINTPFHANVSKIAREAYCDNYSEIAGFKVVNSIIQDAIA